MWTTFVQISDTARFLLPISKGNGVSLTSSKKKKTKKILIIRSDNQTTLFCFVLFFSYFLFQRSESGGDVDDKPTSWPRSRMESQTHTLREKRKPQSSSPSSRNHPASVRHMKRFQKSTAIYTLPIRGKQCNGTPGKTGKSHTNTHTYTHKSIFNQKLPFSWIHFDFGGVNRREKNEWWTLLHKVKIGYFFELIEMYWCHSIKKTPRV